jgi:hypothetical protein
MKRGWADGRAIVAQNLNCARATLEKVRGAPPRGLSTRSWKRVLHLSGDGDVEYGTYGNGRSLWGDRGKSEIELLKGKLSWETTKRKYVKSTVTRSSK